LRQLLAQRRHRVRPPDPLGDHRPWHPRIFREQRSDLWLEWIYAEPRAARSHIGGRSQSDAARSVFLATLSRLAISLMGTPLARCNRRISAELSTLGVA
jgi:hypothetical protein